MLTGQIMFHLDKKSLPEAAEAMDSLRSVGKHFYDNPDSYRMTQFVRLMHQVLKANFKLNELVNTEKYYNALVAHPFFYRGLLNELEVIPYEKLWNHVLTKL